MHLSSSLSSIYCNNNNNNNNNSIGGGRRTTTSLETKKTVLSSATSRRRTSVVIIYSSLLDSSSKSKSKDIIFTARTKSTSASLAAVLLIAVTDSAYAASAAISSSTTTSTIISKTSNSIDQQVGPLVCSIAAVIVFYIFFDGAKQTKEIKEELDSRGVDSSLFTKLYELKYILKALDTGDTKAYDEAVDKVQWQRTKIVVATGSITEVQKMKKFWQSKANINVKTLADLDKVESYMVKKYGGKKSKI
jgi:hypothetical protein